MKDNTTNTKATAKRTHVWYCVTATFPNSGIVRASITATTTATKKPRSTFKTTNWADIYCDWYGTRAAAERAIKEALAA